MIKLGIFPVALSTIFFVLLFSVWCHGVFYLQVFKHTVNSEFLEKLQAETLRLADAYETIQSEEKVAIQIILNGNAVRSQQIVQQIAGLIAAKLEREGPQTSPEEKAGLLSLLSAHNTGKELNFWIFDDQGNLLLEPDPYMIGFKPDYRQILSESTWNSDEGTISLSWKAGRPASPGYGKRIPSLGWTVVSFQPVHLLERKIQGLETLKRIRTDRLIAEMGKEGSAGIVDETLRFRELTYTPLEGHPVDDLRLEGSLPPSKLLFNRESGFREYVILDVVGKGGKYRQAYMTYDEDTGMTYFITQNKRGLFQGLDQRTFPLLTALGGTIALLWAGALIGKVWRIFVPANRTA